MWLLKLSFKTILLSFLLLFSIYSASVIIWVGTRGNTDNSLVLLASQFLHGHISLIFEKGMPIGDISRFGGKFYLYFGPFSSVVLMPFVAIFGRNFPQVSLGIASMITSFYLSYEITKSFKFKKIDAFWLSLFFVFSTVLFSASVINVSAYQVEVLGVPLVLFSLREYFSKKRPLIMGVFLGLAVMTRSLLVLGVAFFVFEFFQKRLTRRQLLIFFIPVIVSCSVLGVYNYVRFHSLFETGYKYNITLRTYPLDQNLNDGYMSPKHVPANLYSLFVMPPQPLLENKDGFVLKFPYLKASPWGMAIWFTSPLFLTLLFKFKRSKYSLSLIMAIIVLSIPIISYYSIGFSQFGYRYALDFLPFLFLLLLSALSPKLSKSEILLISIGVIFNAVYTTSLWGIYPVIGLYH